ncbi:hypothetical protein [Nonomuraea sp. LPB2021202275-12-8]|uniref:hypothetical protein n=1 Tax=Nonomuraea sp. LPB2021202275-12-8 TaxID=3120159 RepID=UPI00300D32B1
MARTRATAVSAMVLALGLAGIGVTPFIGQSAIASASAFDPPVEPCDVGDECQTAPETTITVTTTPPPTTEPESPETTITKTVTATPTRKTQAPKPTVTKTTQAPEPPPTTQSADPPQPLPTQSVEVPSTSSTPEDSSVVLPSVAGTDTPTPPAETEAQSSESDEIPLEMRNAAPEFDQRTLTQQLSIPALILVLLALFAVLIFEGRLRRMAHAAAIRKAGPQAGRLDPHGYPAGPGYATAAMPAPGYPGGTAYAPIISFVPVQTYPGGQVQYGAVYQDPSYQDPSYQQDPGMYGQPGHAPEQPPAAQPEPVVLQPDQFDSFSHQPSPEGEAYRSPFEPVIPAEPPPTDIPPGGANPYEDSPEYPLPAASAAEPGDSEPWGGGLPLPGHEPEGLDPVQDETTVVQPLPPAKSRRGFGRRRK